MERSLEAMVNEVAYRSARAGFYVGAFVGAVFTLSVQMFFKLVM